MKPPLLPDLKVVKTAVGVVLHVKDGEIEQDLLANGHTEGKFTLVFRFTQIIRSKCVQKNIAKERKKVNNFLMYVAPSVTRP